MSRIMKKSLSGIVLTGMLTLLGCGNALFFYETGKLSLTLEARPDSSQPVQGNLGFKQRTVVVAPPMTVEKRGPDSTVEKAQTDSGSMIASFRVDRKPGWTGPINIETSLVTGRAALCLSQDETENAAQAVVAVFNIDPNARPLRARIIAWLDTDDPNNPINRPKLKAWLAEKKFVTGADNETNWLFQAPTTQLEEAIKNFKIP